MSELPQHPMTHSPSPCMSERAVKHTAMNIFFWPPLWPRITLNGVSMAFVGMPLSFYWEWNLNYQKETNTLTHARYPPKPIQQPVYD